jgi:hypothetical protein
MTMRYDNKGSITQRSGQAPPKALARQAVLHRAAGASLARQIPNFRPSQQATDAASRVLTYTAAGADRY